MVGQKHNERQFKRKMKEKNEDMYFKLFLEKNVRPKKISLFSLVFKRDEREREKKNSIRNISFAF